MSNLTVCQYRSSGASPLVLAVYLNLVAADSTYDKQLLIEIIIWHMERPQGHLDELNAMPLYPTEDIIWNESLVPSGGMRVFE